MPRRSRVSTGQFVFHVLNRAVQGVTLFERPADYELFVGILEQAIRRFRVKVLAFAVMPNHWHLVLWPLDDDSLSPFMKWQTAIHAMQWRAARGSQGRGAVYQGRFKAITVQQDAHFLRVCRYVERNPLRARLVARAEDWPWSSAAPTASLPGRPALSPWPVAKPAYWSELLNVPESARSLRTIRAAVKAGRHFGSASWRLSTAATLKWRSGLTQRGKPVTVDTNPESQPTITIP
jgi:putative transposase